MEPSRETAVQGRTLLLWGATGWMGSQLTSLWPKEGWTVVAAKSRLEQVDATEAELDEVRPTHVLIAAALTGRPNVDWCEDHKAEVLAVNYAGPLMLAMACSARKIHCTILGSGCIYQHDAEHPSASDDLKVGFSETDPPNFKGSFYSRTKALLEETIAALGLEGILVLRLRMPITGDGSPRCLLTKLRGYKDHVVDGLHNSISFLPDLLPLVPKLAEEETAGILNFVQPGAMTNREILEACFPDEAESFTFVDASELPKLVKAPRSNCVLSSERLAGCCGGALRTSSECLKSRKMISSRPPLSPIPTAETAKQKID